MALPITIPYTFTTATSSIPLSNLDSDFTTVVNAINGIGNGTNALSNVTISGGSITGNVSVSGNLTFTGGLVPASSFKRNRIINGNMLIDQRNAGASVTPTDGQYTLDRFRAGLTQTSKFSVQQNAGSVTPPVGFTNYLGVTSLTSYAVAAGDIFAIQQNVEGYNVGDLNWGTANAKTVTLSFQVYSSLTGTFGGCLRNSAANRSYPFLYTVSLANTWTSVSITIPGDTSGTWLTTNGIGIIVQFGLGVGSTYSGAAGSWSSSLYISATGAVSVVGTSGATFYLTGVQLEIGSVATPYEFNPYNDQLAQCQRYYYVANTNSGGYLLYGSLWIGSQAFYLAPYPVTMRTRPSCTYTYSTGSFTADYGTASQAQLYTSSVSTNGVSLSAFAASAEL